ncbi:MAG: helix-turn-helix domain-containing protein [Candidatus Sumerlaeia bacterium]|nr:helix-turn-helix domain-containing protein [Candidatus Sumerlaeia bacterium]
MEQLLRIPRVAKILDVSKKRIYNLIAEGKLEAVNLGIRQTRVTWASLESYVERLRKRRRVELGLEEDDPHEPFFPDAAPRKQPPGRV